MNFTWSGQSCGSTSRVFLHESIHDAGAGESGQAAARAAQARHPDRPATTMGSLVSRAQLDKVQGLL
jgi:betaine-aldehyde dehydrogenase